MSFRFSRPGRGHDDPWFRIGTLDVGTVWLVVLLSIVSIVVFAVEPIDKPIMRALVMYPEDVLRGEVWRVVTWPFANVRVSLFTALTIFFFYYFGIELESQIGKKRFLWFFLGCTLVLALDYVALNFVLPFDGRPLAALDLVELMVLLAYVLEYPHRRFFFNIPGWVIGVVLVGIYIVQLLGYRDWFGLVAFLIGLALCAVVARSVGMLNDYRRIPSLRRTGHRGGRRAPRRTTSRRPRLHGTHSGPTVVAGPWGAVSKDQAELDALLDKVSQHGIGALTDKDRARITELRERIRRL